MKRNRFDDFLKSETLMKSQKNFCVSMTFSEYNTEIDITYSQKKFYDKYIAEITHTAI